LPVFESLVAILNTGAGGFPAGVVGAGVTEGAPFFGVSLLSATS
jgi:hypothetical protein